jgi:L-rhamnose-H+ transport protein
MILGLFLAVMCGISWGIFLAPLRVIKVWQWENIWPVWNIVGLFLGPVVVAVWTIPHYLELNRVIGLPMLLLTVLVGGLAGTSGFLYAVTIPVIGLGLATALNAGTCMAMALLPLVVLHHKTFLHPSGWLAAGGVVLSITGLSFCSKGGGIREAELKQNNELHSSAEAGAGARTLSFAKSVALCCSAGVITSTFNLALAFPNPVINTARRLGYSEFSANNAFSTPFLIGGAISNCIYAAFLLRRNNTFVRFMAPGWWFGAFWSVIMGGMFLFAVLAYTKAISLLGSFGGVIAWGLSMAAMILISSSWDALMGEWKGPAAQAMKYGVGILMVALLALSLAQYFSQIETM